MKKIFKILFIFLLLIPYFFIPVENVSGKTLGDLKQELNQTIQQLENNQAEKKLTQDQIDQIQQNIKNINEEIEQINNQILQLIKDIEDLNIQITEKDKEIKKIVNFLEISNGEAAYLEYTFGAKDFTDFIYRAAVSEQLADYNDKLIDDYNNLIKSKEETQKNLNEQKKNLAKKQEELKKEAEKLGDKINQLDADAISIEDSIATQKEIIYMYEHDKQCKDDEDIRSCGTDKLPSDTAFWRPLDHGWISSNYGYRSYWLNGSYVSDFHSGVDMGVDGGTPIYATANGTVASITWYSSCGGNYVFIHHYVNGEYYTSLYMHMRDIYVQVGDTVTKNTVIGTVGGNPYVEYWDSCSTGSHLHFTMFRGRVGIDYYSWGGEYYANRYDPRLSVNFPPLESGFSDRTTRY